jgi:hypothetical protein
MGCPTAGPAGRHDGIGQQRDGREARSTFALIALITLITLVYTAAA